MFDIDWDYDVPMNDDIAARAEEMEVEVAVEREIGLDSTIEADDDGDDGEEDDEEQEEEDEDEEEEEEEEVEEVEQVEVVPPKKWGGIGPR